MQSWRQGKPVPSPSWACQDRLNILSQMFRLVFVVLRLPFWHLLTGIPKLYLPPIENASNPLLALGMDVSGCFADCSFENLFGAN